MRLHFFVGVASARGPPAATLAANDAEEKGVGSSLGR
jgi:hypothetical protein